MTVDDADLKADMHRAIQAWFDCPVTTRPSAFALGDRIRTIALAACASTTMVSADDPRQAIKQDYAPKEFWTRGL